MCATADGASVNTGLYHSVNMYRQVAGYIHNYLFTAVHTAMSIEK